MNNRLDILELSIGYSKALTRPINLQLGGNKLVALVGRNGKGKSTLLHTLSGELAPIAGEIKLNDSNVHNMSLKERAIHMSTVSTKQAIIANISAHEYIAFGRYPYTNWLGIRSEIDENIIAQAIQLCGAEELKDKAYSELSDGERQRINIAKAIAQDTPLILLDEPTAHLDLIQRFEILKLLKTLTLEKEKLILFSTHHIEHALQLADEIWLIDNGVEAFKPEELIENELFHQLFTNEQVYFDAASSSFKFK